MKVFKSFWAYLMRNKHLFLLCYAAVYIPWFVFIEKKVTVESGYHLIHMRLDDLIPFCEYFVLAYYAWFVYMIAAIIYIAFFDGKSCWKMGAFLLTGMTLFLIISTVYPNGHELRPTTFARDNIFVDLVKNIYASDTPTNLLPSIHVYNSIGVHFALTHCDKLMNNPKLKWMKPASLIIMILIILSTVFIKQHSVVDVIMGIVLAIIMYFIVYFRPTRS